MSRVESVICLHSWISSLWVCPQKAVCKELSKVNDWDIISIPNKCVNGLGTTVIPNKNQENANKTESKKTISIKPLTILLAMNGYLFDWCYFQTPTLRPIALESPLRRTIGSGGEGASSPWGIISTEEMILADMVVSQKKYDGAFLFCSPSALLPLRANRGREDNDRKWSEMVLLRALLEEKYHSILQHLYSI